MRRLCGVILLLVAACDEGGSAGALDAAAPADTAALDAPEPDAAMIDAAPAPDAPPPDAMLPPDAFVADAGVPAVIGVNANLTVDTLTAGRVCAEAPQFAVTVLASTSATVAAAPVGDCLAPGDEVLLINLQGSAAATPNVGNWELLQVADVVGAVVTFTTAKTRFYGATTGMDDAIGAAAGEQKVALVRVPRFGAVSIGAGATVTAAKWDGATGGVVALHAASFTIDGTVSATGLGYRAGRWSRDTTCTASLQTESGESITGPVAASTLRNAGGAGGIAALSGVSFNGNTPLSPSAGHAAAGSLGTNGNGRTLGEPGEAYGAGDGSRLTMGSGASGNLTCDVGMPFELIGFDIGGGGIVLLVGGDVTVGAGGVVTAAGKAFNRDTSASGGYVLVVGGDVSLGSAQVLARGGSAPGGSPATAAMSCASSPGYIAVDASGTVTGTTDPVFTVVP